MKHKEPQDALFSYPTPKRWADSVPGIALKWCQVDHQCDNIGVMAWRLPDNKTTVFTTDQPGMLTFSTDDLTTKVGK